MIRNQGRWHSLIQVPADAPDLSVQLLASADAALPGERNVSVVIPSDQVLYLETAPNGGTDGLSRALDGQTPYPVSALRLDWRHAKDRIQIAAIPIEVMHEAEAFVRALGLEPSGVVARPDDDRFDGTPWFGRAIDPAPQALAPEADGQDVLDLRPGSASDPTPLSLLSQDLIRSSRERASLVALVEPSSLTPLPDIDPASADSGTPGQVNPVWVRMLKSSKWRNGVAVAALLVVGLLSLAALFPADPETADAPKSAIGEQKIAADLRQAPKVAAPSSESEAPLAIVVADGEAAPDTADLSASPVPGTTASSAVRAVPDPQIATVDRTAPDLTVAAVTVPAPMREPALPSGPADEAKGRPSFFTPAPGLRSGASVAALDDLAEPGLDPSFRTDALALPEPDLPEVAAAPNALTPPPAPDATFTVDARGLVAPSKEGQETQDGVVVFEGVPPVLARPRPVLQEPVSVEVTDRDSLAKDDPLRRLIPRKRPDGLADRFERNRLGGKTVAELEVLRPAMRPKSIQDRIVEAPPTAQAAASSPRPAARSAGKAQLFFASLNKAKRQPTAKAAAASKPAVRSQDVGAPTAPTPAKVAKQATTSNRIDLSHVNLLGTYGASSRQRALVRLANGRVLNVKVGDRMDGGKVSEIRQGQLSYVKSGRSVTLQMPKG